MTITLGEDYTPGCLLHYDYIKNRYRLTAVDLSRQKKIDADPKAIHQIEFVGHLKRNYITIVMIQMQLMINLCLF